ncbi:hypothetical protein D3C73_1346970 [compost metagenome]
MTLQLHNDIAILTQLWAGSRMNGIVNAGMKRLKATQHPAVGSVHDGIGFKLCNISLP